MARESLAKLAAAVGVSLRTLHTWLDRGCPRSSADAIRVWRAAHVLPRQGGPRKTRRQSDSGDADGGDLQRQVLRARRYKERQQARAIKLKNDVLSGKLIDRADVVREYAEQFAVARSILEGFPDALAKEAPAELRTVAFTLARNRVDAVLRLLSQLGTADA